MNFYYTEEIWNRVTCENLVFSKFSIFPHFKSKIPKSQIFFYHSCLTFHVRILYLAAIWCNLNFSKFRDFSPFFNQKIAKSSKIVSEYSCLVYSCETLLFYSNWSSNVRKFVLSVICDFPR